MPAVHRNSDLRICGATTIVTGQSTVFVNNKLASVHDDPNSHTDGELIATDYHVYVNNKLIITHHPDNAKPDLLCGGSADSGEPIDDNLLLHCNPKTNEGSPNVFVGS